MKNFLILSVPEDIHANYVSWALEKAGYKASFINSRHDGPLTHTSLYLDEQTHSFESVEWSQAEAAWCRRLGFTLGWRQNSDDEDEKFIQSEKRLFTKWLYSLQENSLRWINPPIAEQAAENKFAQLKFAKVVGLKVPRTLVTADPKAFRTFLKSEGAVVAKTLGPFEWESISGKILSPFATLLNLDQGDALSDDDISQCVTMYQQHVKKIADVRVVVLGRDILARKVSQMGENHLDYRIGFHLDGHLRYEHITLPDELKERIRCFVDRLNINFASADFALTDDGDFVFLDLNPSGQWMFLDEGLPDPNIGQSFCSFFVHGFVHPEAREIFPSISEYKLSQEAKDLIALQEQLSN